MVCNGLLIQCWWRGGSSRSTPVKAGLSMEGYEMKSSKLCFAWKLGCSFILLLCTTLAQADIAVKFLGTAMSNDVSDEYRQKIMDSGVMANAEGFLCYQAPLYDLETGHQRGAGVDCLRPYRVESDIISIEAVTFFFLPQGMLANHGCTSVSPMQAGVGDAGVTHTTGSIPPSEFGVMNYTPDPACESLGEDFGIIHTTGGFKNFIGGARLSGAVNLSKALDEITFSCLFIIDIEPRRGRSTNGHR